MDHFRRCGGGGEDKEDDPRSSSSAFSPPAIIRDPSSAFSKPILPSSSSLLSKPQFGSPPNGASAPGPDPITPSGNSGGGGGTARYRECLRNHAASLGGHVTDGCGEFMPVGPADPLKCAACGCHRSFHRREPEPDNKAPSYRVPLLLAPAPHANPLRFGPAGGNTTDQSSSEERHNINHNAPPHASTLRNNNARTAAGACEGEGSEGRKKRFRTKFSSEQKERMRAFAERIGWRVQKKDEGEMERFCADIGVAKPVLKVWMHNNKHLFSRNKQEDLNNTNSQVKVEGLMMMQNQSGDGGGVGADHHHHHGV